VGNEGKRFMRPETRTFGSWKGTIMQSIADKERQKERKRERERERKKGKKRKKKRKKEIELRERKKELEIKRERERERERERVDANKNKYISFIDKWLAAVRAITKTLPLSQQRIKVFAPIQKLSSGTSDMHPSCFILLGYHMPYV
jgi:hypothetical protein